MHRAVLLLGLGLSLTACASARPATPPRAATEAEKTTIVRALAPLLPVSGIWRGPGDGCAVAVGIATTETINLGVGPHARCKFALLITEGALRELSPPELQAALAHELGHVQLDQFEARRARRTAQRETEDRIDSRSSTGAAAVTAIPFIGPVLALGAMGANVVAHEVTESRYRSYDRQDEEAADGVAVELLTQLGPGHCHALVTLFERVSRGPRPERWRPWARSHRSIEDRLARVRVACGEPGGP